jgi:predicted RNase H-like nuclease (RuvC/YqgF family)
LLWVQFIGEELMTQRTEELKDEMEEDKRAGFKIMDKLEQRIATLEKVLDSHAKCIGELRGTELRIHDLKDKKDH